MEKYRSCNSDRLLYADTPTKRNLTERNVVDEDVRQTGENEYRI